MSATSLQTCVDRAGVSTHREILNASALKVMRVASWWWKTAWVSQESTKSKHWHTYNQSPLQLDMIWFIYMQRQHFFLWNSLVCEDKSEKLDLSQTAW